MSKWSECRVYAGRALELAPLAYIAAPLPSSFYRIWLLFFTLHSVFHLSSVTTNSSGCPQLPFVTIICSCPEDYLLRSVPGTYYARCEWAWEYVTATGRLANIPQRFHFSFSSARTRHKLLRNYFLPKAEFHSNRKKQHYPLMSFGLMLSFLMVIFMFCRLILFAQLPAKNVIWILNL